MATYGIPLADRPEHFKCVTGHPKRDRGRNRAQRRARKANR